MLLRFPAAAFAVLATFLFAAAGRAGPVELIFSPAPDARNPFSREIWAEVAAPSGRVLRLPAFFIGEGRFAVRARPEEAGPWRLGRITEAVGARAEVELKPVAVATGRVDVRAPATLPAVRLDPANPAGFARADGSPFIPIGANLAWPDRTGLGYYATSFAAFHREGLNWTRVWMAHWGGLNLDWLEPARGRSPPPGSLDLGVAAAWDELLARAEEHGVYVQVVLQHHGQLSTVVDPNWDLHPWNTKNPGGIIARPGDFFTSAEARRATRQKYRYIAARWGWSPAVMAWELFNEAHGTDAIRFDHEVGAVARWHGEMAACLRAADAYGHLVTTSAGDPPSPVYARMDFLQPHVYPADLLTALRTFDVPPAQLGRPVFYAEYGDKHAFLSEASRASGNAMIPPVWASLMGTGPNPAQPWLSGRALDAGRLTELGAVARFIAGSGLAQHAWLAAFSAVIESPSGLPLFVPASQIWKKLPATEVAVPLDGRRPVEWAQIPCVLVGHPDRVAEGHARRVTFRLDYPRAATLRVVFSRAGERGAAVRLTLDGATATECAWTVGGGAQHRELTCAMTPGPHTVMLENIGGSDWAELLGLYPGIDTAALAAIGRRDENFLALWLWHRTGVFAPLAPPPAGGTLLLAEVPAGRWRVTWWDTFTGAPAAPVFVAHHGGHLRVPVPPLSRHAAVTLSREGDPH